MKSVTEKGFPASLNYAVTRGKGKFSFRFSQLVTAASYSEADVSARPNSLNLFLPTIRRGAEVSHGGGEERIRSGNGGSFQDPL